MLWPRHKTGARTERSFIDEMAASKGGDTTLRVRPWQELENVPFSVKLAYENSNLWCDSSLSKIAVNDFRETGVFLYDSI